MRDIVDLHYAALKGSEIFESTNPEDLEFFKKKFSGFNVLHTAIFEGQTEVCDEILNGLGDEAALELIAEVNNENDNAIHLAVRRRQYDILERLLWVPGALDLAWQYNIRDSDCFYLTPKEQSSEKMKSFSAFDIAAQAKDLESCCILFDRIENQELKNQKFNEILDGYLAELNEDHSPKDVRSFEIGAKAFAHAFGIIGKKEALEFLAGTYIVELEGKKSARSKIHQMVKEHDILKLATIFKISGAVEFAKIKNAKGLNALQLAIALEKESSSEAKECATIIDFTENKEDLLDLIAEKNNDGCTAIHFASERGCSKSLEKLLEVPRAINLASLKDNQGYNALHIAIIEKKPEICFQLLEADPNLISSKLKLTRRNGSERFYTPLDLAKDCKNAEICSILIKPTLDYNAKSRAVKIKQEIEGANFGEYGVLTLLKLEEDSELEKRQERIFNLAALLGIFEEKNIHDELQKDVRVIETREGYPRLGEEIKEEDKFLRNFINKIFNQDSEAGNLLYRSVQWLFGNRIDDKEKLDAKMITYDALYQLVHCVYYDKLNFSAKVVGGNRYKPEYFNSYNPENFSYLVDEKSLSEEIKQTLFDVVSKQKESLLDEYLAISPEKNLSKDELKDALEKKVSSALVGSSPSLTRAWSLGSLTLSRSNSK